MKVSKSGLDVGILPTDQSQIRTKPSAFSKYQATPSELSRRGLHAMMNPCLDGAMRPKHTRVPSYGSEYSKLLAI
jgi:hypothetical protein